MEGRGSLSGLLLYNLRLSSPCGSVRLKVIDQDGRGIYGLPQVTGVSPMLFSVVNE